MSKPRLLSISVIIPTYNESVNLRRLLPSLVKQTYPKSKIEYIIVDDGSTDDSVQLAKKFKAKLIQVNTHDIELNKGIGMHAAKNDLVYWLDADMELCDRNFWQKLAQPLVDDPTIFASFTQEFAINGQSRSKYSSLLRFISYHPLQQDPLYAFFSPSLTKTIVAKYHHYYLLNFIPGQIPAVGRILYRRLPLLKTAVGRDKSFIDLESVEIVARAGYHRFAYVPTAKIRHYHAQSLDQLIRKRLRNLSRDYLPNLEHKYFLWFDPNKPGDVLKIIGWVIWANLIIPETVRGLINLIRHRDWCFLWQPIVAVTTTDAILWGFLSKPKGRQFAHRLIRKVLPV